MKSKFFVFIVFTLAIGCTNKSQVDLILKNGKIYTVDSAFSTQSCVIIHQSKIIATGDAGLLDKYASQKTIDLKGKTVTPGFIESHGHFMLMGYNMLDVDLLGSTSYAEIIARLKEKSTNIPEGSWIIGRGWHQDKWREFEGERVNGFPTHHLLSEAFPDHPVALDHASGHALLVNNRAMQLAKISNAGPVPGGEIVRDSQGKPTGIFVETAQVLITKHIPENSESRMSSAFDRAMKNCAKNGITSFHNAGSGANTVNFLLAQHDSTYLTRLYVMLNASDDNLLSDYFKKGPQIGLKNNFLTIRSVKIWADGALGSRGAWLIDPYSDMPNTHGHQVTDTGIIADITKKCVDNGFQVCTHAIGDKANREVLNIYEKVLKGKNQESIRLRIEHAQHIHNSDIPRFGDLGVIASVQGIHMSSDRPWAIDRLGRKRIEDGAYAWRMLIDSDAIVINGTDVPVEPLNPMASYYSLISRKTLEGNPEGGYEPNQKMTREEALRSYTIWAAYGAFEEKIKGSIENGKLADLVIWSDDLMKVNESEILGIVPEMTILNGQIIYQAKP